MNLEDNGLDVKSEGCSGWCEGDTPLMWACKIKKDPNRIKFIRFLLESGADVNATGSCQITPLMEAVRIKGNLEVVKLLVEYGADINKKDSGRYTALHGACGNFEIIKYLVENGADIHAKDEEGQSPLTEAVEYGYYEIAKYLIELDSSIDLKSYLGMDLLRCATINNYSPPKSKIKDRFKLIRYLLDNGADINGEDSEYSDWGYSPLLFIFSPWKENCYKCKYREKHPEKMVKFLLKNSADAKVLLSEKIRKRECSFKSEIIEEYDRRCKIIRNTTLKEPINGVFTNWVSFWSLLLSVDKIPLPDEIIICEIGGYLFH